MNTIQEIENLQQEIKKLENLLYEYLDEPKESNKINAALKERYRKLKILREIQGQEKKDFSFSREKEQEETKTKKEEKDIVYETFNDDSLNCNQWIIEIHKAGRWEYYDGDKKFKEDFTAYHGIFNALMRIGEQKACVYALLNYLNNNIHMFNFVLWKANFEKLTGVKETTYKEGINALFYYGILEATNRMKRNKKNICCKVYIFHTDLNIESLPKERFNPKNPEHMKIVKARKG